MRKFEILPIVGDVIIVKNNKFLVQKWFTNDKEALLAFYQKKLTLHTPILVRYPLANFKVTYESGKLKFFDAGE
jgi:hypothetical protein